MYSAIELSVIYISASFHIATVAIAIANHSRWKSFVVAKINNNLLENICG